MLPDVNNDQSLKINYEDLIQTHEVVERRPPKMSRISSIQYYLGGGFKYLLFSSLLGQDEPILTHIFQLG